MSCLEWIDATLDLLVVFAAFQVVLYSRVWRPSALIPIRSASMPHILRSIEPKNELIAELEMFMGFDDLAGAAMLTK